MAFGTWAFGPYTATIATNADGSTPVDIGLNEGPHRFIQIAKGANITPNRFGDSVVDGIYRGANCLIQMSLKEYTAAVKRIIWPFSPTDLGLTGIIGRANSDIGRQLILTAISGTPAATNGPATRTCPLAIFAPEHNMELIMGNDERNIPLVCQILPALVTAGTSQLRHFTDS